jgi:hypothetical protein
MTTATRTLNPLPFQDLEPKRFEDLVRQLAYDFRPWRRLEATGRSGGDEGFDARGLEVVGNPAQRDDAETADDEQSDVSAGAPDRLWLVQCKRERVIGPSKAEAHLKEIVVRPEEPLYGLIFAACCDLSKKTRDAIIEWGRTNGLEEVHVWGRGELEDMLFQPKNDHLLFAYFGISLVIRRRSQATQLRSDLAMKRKLLKTVALSSAAILVRDPADDSYPYVEEGTRPTGWWVYDPEGVTHRGLMLSVRWHQAFVDFSTGEWDAADAVASMEPHHPWRVDDPEKERLNQEASKAWNSFPERNRGWVKLSRFVSFRSILAVDEDGDDVFQGTHLYVPFHPTHGPFIPGRPRARLTTTSHFDGERHIDVAKRIKRFPDFLRSGPGVEPPQAEVPPPDPHPESPDQGQVDL